MTVSVRDCTTVQALGGVADRTHYQLDGESVLSLQHNCDPGLGDGTRAQY
jgi:hypothetical protein